MAPETEDFGNLLRYSKILYNASRYVMPRSAGLQHLFARSEENSAVVNAFIRENTNFIPNRSAVCPVLSEIKEAAEECRNLFPHIDGTDGFF